MPRWCLAFKAGCLFFHVLNSHRASHLLFYTRSWACSKVNKTRKLNILHTYQLDTWIKGTHLYISWICPGNNWKKLKKKTSLSRHTYGSKRQGGRGCVKARWAFYMVYIAYYTELNFQICNYAQKHRICRENSKYALDLLWPFLPSPKERLPTSATLYYGDSTSFTKKFLMMFPLQIEIWSFPDVFFCFH